MFRKLLLALLLLVPTTASAQWKEASTRHFLVYSEGSEERLRDAATALEAYDFLLRSITKATPAPSPIKLKVYLVEGLEGVQGTLPSGIGAGVGGYYQARARGPIAVVPERNVGRGSYSMNARSTLFHEYAHHFMLQNFPAAYPSWYVEGFAEYYGQTKIHDGNRFEVGLPAEDRYMTMRLDRWLPLDKMLAAKTYVDVDYNVLQLYAQGWLLVHYLSANNERAAKLQRYLSAINAGKDFATARDEAFGRGASQLDAELRTYSRKRRLDTLNISFPTIDTGPIEIRTLTAAEQALLPFDIVLGRVLYAREAEQFLKKLRPVAERFPDDPTALRLLAETERLAGNGAAASAIVDRWLALHPGSARAMMHKAELQIEASKKAGSVGSETWKSARNLLLKAHAADKKDPLVLEAYYDSFTAEGVLPPVRAQNALYAAFELVPQDDKLRYKVARDFEQRNMIQEAIDTIKPSAFELHSPDSESERQKARREREEEKWREAGSASGEETPREMLQRLEKKLAEQQPAAAAQSG